jgi:gliding motility-associated-like protein
LKKLTTVFLLINFFLCKAQTKPVITTSVNQGFIENKGQLIDQNNKPNSNVKYLLCHPGFNVQLRQTGFSYDTYTDTKDTTAAQIKFPSSPKFKQPEYFKRNFHRVDVELLNCNSNAEIEATGRSKTCFNYFTTGTPRQGITNVYYYKRVLYKNIYPHIDLAFFAEDGKKEKAGLEYNFILHPGADINDIKLMYKGMNDVLLDHGAIKVQVAAGVFEEKIPSSYFNENGQQVNVSYNEAANNVFSFRLPAGVSITHDLVIDPTPNLQWGTYIGGNSWDFVNSIALDASSNVYVAGGTNSPNNIATSGAYQTTYGGGYADCLIAELDPTGSTLLWATYYGGPAYDDISALKLDAAGNIYVSGITQSSSGIATAGAYKTINTATGNYNTFVAKFNSNASALLWGTYYGGIGPDWNYSMAIDSIDNVFIVGTTKSTTGISTPGAYQVNLAGGYDGYVAKFDSSGAALLWGTYYGGTAVDTAGIIMLDATDNVYIAGMTQSSSGIATPGAYKTNYTGGNNGNVFIAKLNSSGSALLWGTYYGGNGRDFPGGVRMDAQHNIYVTGVTRSATGIATAGAFQTTYNGGLYGNAFVARFNPTCTSLLWGTYVGSTAEEIGDDICLDSNKYVYIAGVTSNTTGDATPGAYQTVYGGGIYDAFLAKFDSTGSSRIWETYYGGAGEDAANVLAIDKKLNLYVAGLSSSTSNVATAGAYQTGYGGNPWDCLVAKFSENCDLIGLKTAATKYAICGIDSVTATVTPMGSDYVKYVWSQAGQTSASIQFTPANTATYFVTVTDTIGLCSITDSVSISVNPIPVVVIKGINAICNGNSTLLTASGGATYLWNTGSTADSVVVSPNSTSVYNVMVSQNGCKDSASSKVVVNPLPVVKPCCDTSILFGESVQLTSSGGSTYVWTPAQGLNCSTCSNPVASPATNTTYTLMVTSDSGCSVSQTITIDVSCGNIFIPDAFSPNNDGQNDYLYVRGDCIKTMQFEIFDRWGNKVFETTDKSIPWNGQCRGEAMNTGSYVYYLSATMYDGTTQTKKGNVTLVR